MHQNLPISQTVISLTATGSRNTFYGADILKKYGINMQKSSALCDCGEELVPSSPQLENLRNDPRIFLIGKGRKVGINMDNSNWW